MSDILIKGMEMPKYDEFIAIYSNGTAKKTKVLYNEECTEYLQIGKATEAIEIPKHGRLIDGDWAERELVFDYAFAAAKMVREMPTFIPASEESTADGSMKEMQRADRLDHDAGEQKDALQRGPGRVQSRQHAGLRGQCDQ